MKTNTIKTTLKSTLAALSLAILAFAISGCESNGGTHQMGNIKSQSTMRDSEMPARHTGTRAGEGSHQMGNIKHPSTMRDRDMPGR